MRTGILKGLKAIENWNLVLRIPTHYDPPRVSEIMVINVNTPPDKNFGFGLDSPIQKQQDSENTGQNQSHAGIHFGAPLSCISQDSGVNFSGLSSSEHNHQADLDQAASNATDNGSSKGLIDMLEKLLQALAQFMTQYQGDSDTSTGGQRHSRNDAQSATPEAAAPYHASSQPASLADTPQAARPADVTAASPSELAAPKTLTSNRAAPQVSPDAPSVANAAAAVDNPTAGSGPYSLNITNTQDHVIKIGQFDQNEKLVGELTLQPRQKGIMNYEKDKTGFLKQAGSDGYKPEASRLEFYNGFIDVSDIDSRNASIFASDGKGFEIGNKQSIANKAPGNIVSVDSAGNKTITGYYDGSSDKMKQGGAFLTNTLGTGMTYMHPNDDTLGKGRNPMRHTDSMSLDVTFGKP